MREVKFTPIANAQLEQLKKDNRKMYSRIEYLIDSVQQNPYAGIGKPEPLKYDLGGYWSRWITKEHCLVYQVTSDAIIVISCKYHYF